MLKVGVFDSGIGGFSILREIIAEAPNLEIDYVSDDFFAPYGTKSDTEITERSEYITALLLERGAQLIVVACNSATAAAIAELRQNHPGTDFVGVEPYINVLNHSELYPGIEKAAVVTTVLTGNSLKFRELKDRLDPQGRILHFCLPNLATIVEGILKEGLNRSLEERLQKELEPLRNLGLTHLILGCTHYPLIASLIENELQLKTISAAPFVAKRVSALLPGHYGKPPGMFSFMSTSDMHWRERSLTELDRLLRYSGRNY